MGYYSDVFGALLGAGIFIAASYYYWRLNSRRLERPRVCNNSDQYLEKSIEERHDAKLCLKSELSERSIEGELSERSIERSIEGELSDRSLEGEVSDRSLEGDLSERCFEGELSDMSLGDEGTLTSVEDRHDADIGIEDKASQRSLAGRPYTLRSPEDEDSDRLVYGSLTHRHDAFVSYTTDDNFFLRGRPSSSSTGFIPPGEAAEPLPPLDWPPPPPPPEADI